MHTNVVTEEVRSGVVSAVGVGVPRAAVRLVRARAKGKGGSVLERKESQQWGLERSGQVDSGETPWVRDAIVVSP